MTPTDLELRISRSIAAPPAIVWRAWVEHATEWFTPPPWKTPEVDYDLRPGGRANVVMLSPEGERHAWNGVVLEVQAPHRLVTTGAMLEGWIPQYDPMNFIRIDLFEPEGEDGTRYTAIARHWQAEAMEQHREMGFETGWGISADQLAQVAERLAREA